MKNKTVENGGQLHTHKTNKKTNQNNTTQSVSMLNRALWQLVKKLCTICKKSKLGNNYAVIKFFTKWKQSNSQFFLLVDSATTVTLKVISNDKFYQHWYHWLHIQIMHHSQTIYVTFSQSNKMTIMYGITEQVSYFSQDAVHLYVHY